MNNEGSRNQEALVNQVVAWVGLDWADSEHRICLYDVATGNCEASALKHTAEELQQWLAGLQERYEKAKVAIVLEQGRGPVLYALMNYDFVVLYPVNPQSLANYRKTFATSGAKDDPSDARLLMEMVRKHPERFRPWVADDADTRALRLLVEGRRQMVDQVTALTNQLTSHLKNYFPQAVEWAGELDSRQACDFLERWPTLEAVQGARPAQLRKFYQQHGRPRAETLDRRIQQIKQAVPLTRDPAVILAGSVMAQGIASQLRSLIAVVENFDDQIKRLFHRHPDRLVFESLPGAGEVLAPRLLAAFGADRERWQSAAEIQEFSGIAPVTEKSGKSHWVHWRLSCPKFVRQTFHEFAGSSIKWSTWAKAYYLELRSRGKRHHSALRSLAYKWIRILFACWRDRTPYNEQRFLEALQRRGSALSQKAESLAQARLKAKVGTVENL